MERALDAVRIDGVSVAYDGTPAVVDATLTIDAGSTVALLGPSGCGKTSLLRAVAGLEPPTAGSISIGDRLVSGPGTWVRPEKRNVGMVFQDGALFPHLDVAANVAYGLRASGSDLGREDRRRRVDELLELVELAEFADRLPDTLSGGQQQRVALARSLAPHPSVLLLDEPFSALDAGLRVQLRSEVARILREVGVTTVFVTHDQDEAFVVGDLVAVMRDGRVEQFGPPDELYRSPRTPWVAGFVGEANLVHGVASSDGSHVETAIGRIPLSSPVANASDRAEPATSASLDVLVRPEQVALAAPAPGSDETLGAGGGATVTVVEYYGRDVRYELDLGDGSTIAARAHPGSLLQPGDRVVARFLGSSTEAWPADSGRRSG